jgi:hypothetical protein
MKRIVRKTIRVASAIAATASFWVPFCVYATTRDVAASLVAIAASAVIMLFAYYVNK